MYHLPDVDTDYDGGPCLTAIHYGYAESISLERSH